MHATQNSQKTIILIPLILTIAACSSNDDSQKSKLNWAACEDAEAIFECSKLAVPMDYAASAANTIDIALIRHRATGDSRLGSLFVNLGGEAGRGVLDVQDVIAEGILPESIVSTYDIVGFNPRGAVDSTLVDCSDVANTDFNPYPTNVDAIAQLHADYSAFAIACEAKYGDYLQHIGSLNTARDLERIRIALGDAQVNFLAYSFASRVAALFLQEYPESSGRMVLDASVSPDSSQRALLSEPLAQLQAQLLSIITECKSSDPDCDPDALVAALAQRLSTLADSDTEDSLLEFELVFSILEVFFDEPDLGREFSSELVEYINTSDVSVLLRLVGSDEEQDEPEENIIEGDDGLTVGIATLCADDSFRPNVETLVAASEEFNLLSDVFAEIALSEYASCAGWPEALAPLSPITTNTAPTSIVIGGSNDAIAPIEFSEDMAAAIGGVFVRSDHEGHTSVFFGKSECVDNIVESFFIDGTTPASEEC